MFIDSRSLENNALIEGDICIVGAGAAGISIALEWVDTKYNIILLEGGGLGYDDTVQDLYDGKTTGQKYFPLRSSRLHMFGGTTWMWAGMSSPFDPIDFEKRDWVPYSGWPITKKELDPFYDKASEALDLEPYYDNLEHWQKQLPDINPFPLDNTVISHKIWQHSKVRFGEDHYTTLRDAKNLYLFTYANVVDIMTNEGINAVKNMVTKNHVGKSLYVKAKHFILASGAIQNARLLLASNSQNPSGLGNDNDLVGRYFMEHVEMVSAELNLCKPFSTNLYTVMHGLTRMHAELGITEAEQKRHKILNGTTSLMPLNIGVHQKPRIETWESKNPLKALKNNAFNLNKSIEKGRKENWDKYKNKFQLITRMEQAPNPNSRVTLDKEKDELGMPRNHLHWQLTKLERRSIKKLHQLLGLQFEKTGLGYVELMDFLKHENDDILFPQDITNPGWHHMGTTRMDNNPQKGVVDSNCKVHGFDNFFIAGSSCFPTSGAPNPTLTLLALAFRLSDYLKKNI